MSASKVTATLAEQDYHLQEMEKTDIIEDENVKIHDGLADLSALELESRFAHLNRKETIRTFWKVTLYACMVGLGALFDGYAIVVPGSIVANTGFIATFGTLKNAAGNTVMDAQVVGGWGGVQSGGQIFAMWTGPFIADRFGRRAVMYLVCIIVAAAIAVECVTSSYQVYFIARLLSGMAVGYIQGGVPVFISELSQPQIRGAMLAMYSVMYGIGGLGGSSALKIVSNMGPDKFRHAFYSQLVFLGLFLPVIPFLPETPWYYARKHQDVEAKKVMRKLYGGVEGFDIDYEYAVIQQNVSHSEALQALQKDSTLKQIFVGTNGRRTFVSWICAVFGSFCGLSLVFQYNTFFFQLAGLADPFLASLIIKLITLVMTFASFWTVEIFGRRKSLMTGGTICAFMMLVLGVLGATNTTNSGTAMVALFCIHDAAFSIFIAPLGWSYAAETPTPRLRAKTAGFVAGAAAAFGLLFNYTTPLMITAPANWGLKIGFFWFSTTCVMLVVIYFLLPETKGRTFNELDELFERKIPAREFATTRTAADEKRESHA